MIAGIAIANAVYAMDKPYSYRCALLRPHERDLPFHLVQGQVHH